MTKRHDRIHDAVLDVVTDVRNFDRGLRPVAALIADRVDDAIGPDYFDPYVELLHHLGYPFDVYITGLEIPAEILDGLAHRYADRDHEPVDNYRQAIAHEIAEMRDRDLVAS